MQKLAIGIIVFIFSLAIFVSTLSPTYAQASCSTNPGFVKPDTKLSVTIRSGPANTNIDVCVTRDRPDNCIMSYCDSGTDGTGYAKTEIDAPSDEGIYIAYVGRKEWWRCWMDGPPLCAAQFTVSKTGVGPVGPGFDISRWRCEEEGVVTAIGCISTTVPGFVTFLLGYILGLAGLVAFFLIIIAGFQILTSAGNPEKLEGAKQLLTAAVLGLFFIIFSVVILEFMGQEILGGLLGFPWFRR